jgi:hypothetical protein
MRIWLQQLCQMVLPQLGHAGRSMAACFVTGGDEDVTAMLNATAAQEIPRPCESESRGLSIRLDSEQGSLQPNSEGRTNKEQERK